MLLTIELGCTVLRGSGCSFVSPCGISISSYKSKEARIRDLLGTKTHTLVLYKQQSFFVLNKFTVIYR